MNNEALFELIQLCKKNTCSINLQGCTTGIVVSITANRGHVALSTSCYIDQNEKDPLQVLTNAIERIA